MKHSGITLADLSPRYREQVLSEIGKAAEQPAMAVEAKGREKRIRQSEKPVLNKLETRCRDLFVAQRHPGLPIYAQAVRFEVARGRWYKADLFVPDQAGRPTAYEVKGEYAYPKAMDVLKSVARAHPWCRFILVWERAEQRNVWLWQEILP